MTQNKTDASSGAPLSDAELGRIAYEAAAAETGCTQPWEEANQAKWIAGAKAVVAAEGGAVLKTMLAVYDILRDPVSFRTALAASVAKRWKRPNAELRGATDELK